MDRHITGHGQISDFAGVVIALVHLGVALVPLIGAGGSITIAIMAIVAQVDAVMMNLPLFAIDFVLLMATGTVHTLRVGQITLGDIGILATLVGIALATLVIELALVALQIALVLANVGIVLANVAIFATDLAIVLADDGIVLSNLVHRAGLRKGADTG
ncbi:MAG: hypothetical protein M3N23_11200, partial [Pseudomonadota bacterium]|nr:hypothetical protein [Pseudomonadota bacterium]